MRTVFVDAPCPRLSVYCYNAGGRSFLRDEIPTRMETIYMKKQSIGLVIAALLLTACGGGSDDNTPADPNPKNNKGNNVPSAPGKDENTPADPGKKSDNGSSQLIPPPVNQGNSDNASGKYQGKGFIVPLGQQPNGLTDAKSVVSDDLAVLNLDGKKLPLQLPNISSGNITSVRGATIGDTSYKQFIVSGTRYANSKFGYLNDGSKDYIFSQGVPTATMPTTGVVKYSGAAAVGQAAVADSALANFSADFGAKTLTGNISQNASSAVDFKPVNISAGIEGNTFSSKADAAVKTIGGFYGDNAHELGGIFQDSAQAISGSFGAVRSN